MFSSTTFVIRTSSPADAATLDRLAEVDSQRPIEGPALIGEVDGVACAAISIADGRSGSSPPATTSAGA